jgi:hypothetical protein
MSKAEKRRPRTSLIVASLILALCIPVAVYFINYVGKFSMFTKGLAIIGEINAEVSRRGVHCTHDSMLPIPGGASNDESAREENRFIAAFSLHRNSGTSLAATVRLARIEPSVPWIDGVREGEVIRLRFQCREKKADWCIETDGMARRFYGAPLPLCP